MQKTTIQAGFVQLLVACAFMAGVRTTWADSALATPEYYAENIRPLLSEYCLRCHSTEEQKGDLDLERFSSLNEVLNDSKVWQEVIEQLGNDQMPPKDRPQPSTAERERLAGWARAVLDQLGRSRAGDPGRVVLRRLSNAEYTYTVRDLTGIDWLEPTREFPVDGAAGEGFMNTGNALVMSPSLLTKYLDAAKGIAEHAVLLPDGIRFSPKTTPRDWTEEILARIREFYREFTDPKGGDVVNLQGIVFETNEGGRLPLEGYLTATIAERASLAAGEKSIETVARERGLSSKYLEALWQALRSPEPSLLLKEIAAEWHGAKLSEVPELVEKIAHWQKALWKFSSVGHIGKVGGPKAWMEPVNPITTGEEVRLKIPASPNADVVTLYLAAGDAGDGNAGDFVVWQEPHLVIAGRPNLLLRDVREFSRELAERRERIFAMAANALAAAAEATASEGKSDAAELARKHGVAPDVLAAWFNYLGIAKSGPVKIEGHFTHTITHASGYEFVNGWGSAGTPLLLANSSGQHVRIPGNLNPHSVVVHPSPKLNAVVGWRSPVNGTLRIDAKVTHAHPECGNGIRWSLEKRRGGARHRLAAGFAQGENEVRIGPVEELPVQEGDLVSLVIGARDGNHSCDLTAIDLTLAEKENGVRKWEWDLAADVSSDILAGNPHADRLGNEGVWHFYTESVGDNNEVDLEIPEGSLLAQWKSASTGEMKHELAQAIQELLTSGPPAAKESPDARLYRQLGSFRGGLLAEAGSIDAGGLPNSGLQSGIPGAEESPSWGLDAGLFGRHPDGSSIHPASLSMRAPSVIEIRLPADWAAGCEFVTTGALDKKMGAEGSVQLQVTTVEPERDSGLLPSAVTVTNTGGMWTSDNRRISYTAPIVVNEGSMARKRIESAFEEFRELFPAALCYNKIVPVDEVVTLTLFHREDNHLARLMLNDAQKAELDRLWDELRYVSQDALKLVDVFEQLWEFATQDADPAVFEPLREPINQRAAVFRQRLIETEPNHLKAVLEFAGRAYRRPLMDGEAQELRLVYERLRKEELPHEEAIRFMFARVLIAPAFLYRLEEAAPGAEPGPVSDWELANRLSYFLWSSMPDTKLREVAASGRLREPDMLAKQARRMLRDDRTRRLAIEFACQWLHIHGFDTHDEKSERHFPSFHMLRGAMYEEPIRFFTDIFQNDRSVLNMLNADYTFLNGPLAEHYGIPGISGMEWQRVDGVKAFERGGILGFAATLAKQSGASRTSPILRGNWVSEALLGEKLPRPPKDVPDLPEPEANEGLTIRQLVEKHTTDPRCASCHDRIDPFGFALEKFDGIGRWREMDGGGRPIDTRSQVIDGSELEGIDGLREYLLTNRREAVLRQFCVKLLGYALGRAVHISDELLLAEMQAQLKENDHQISAAVETVVRSPQFRMIRGKDEMYED
jgi:hypothetical protein